MTLVRYAADGWGTGQLLFDDELLVHHELPRPGDGRTDQHPLAERLAAYFRGERGDFHDVALDLDWCTPFQLALAEALRSVGPGETVTYGELAALAGRPGAARAAGSFCARNRFPLFVPCHRVVRAGDIGRYGSLGVGYKRRLLALEHRVSV